MNHNTFPYSCIVSSIYAMQCILGVSWDGETNLLRLLDSHNIKSTFLMQPIAMLTLSMNHYKKSSRVTLSHPEKLRVNDKHCVEETKNFPKRNEGAKEIMKTAGTFKRKEMEGKESFWKLSQNMSHWIASLLGSRALEGGTNNNERNDGRGMKKYDGGHDLRETGEGRTFAQSRLQNCVFSAASLIWAHWLNVYIETTFTKKNVSNHQKWIPENPNT